MFVLGVWKYIGNAADIDNLTTPGYYVAWADAFGYYTVKVYKAGNNGIVQEYLSLQELKMRYKTPTDSWGPWKMIPLIDSVAGLASLLGDSLYITCGIIEPGSKTINCAGRFIFISVPGAASTILIYPQYASTEINLIGGNKTSYINYTKTANSRDVTFTNTSSAGAKYIITDLF